MESGGLRLDARAREVRYFGESVDFTSVEFDILELLMRAAGRIVSRDELAVVLYQRRSTPYERSLDVHISHLRKTDRLSLPVFEAAGVSIKFTVIKTRWRWHRQTVATGYWSSQIRRFRCSDRASFDHFPRWPYLGGERQSRSSGRENRTSDPHAPRSGGKDLARGRTCGFLLQLLLSAA
jgi:hypothetical protein